jgi:K+-transporting ATPase c subunit
MHSSGYEIEQDEGSLYPSSKTQGAATKEIARDVKVSQKRVKQIIKENMETGQEPVLGEKVGRPTCRRGVP